MTRIKRKVERTLDEDAIVDAALKLVRRHGIEKLSMRALARDLDVSPMALYHHVPSKAALLDRIREAVIAVVPDARASFDETIARQAQPALTEERIIEAALEIVREHTAYGLSMRGLAKHLGVSPMALYHHVSNKEDLVERLRDAVAARVPLPNPSRAQWQAQMRHYLVEWIHNMAQYPGLMRPRAGRTMSKGDRRMTRHGIAVLLAAGFEPEEAAAAISTCHLQAFGLLGLSDLIARGKMPKPRNRRLPPGAEPDVGAHLRAIDFKTMVEYSIDTTLRGLAVRLDESLGESLAQSKARAPAPRGAAVKRTR